MHLSLLSVISMFFTAIANSNDIDSDLSNPDNDEFGPEVLIDENSLVTLNDVLADSENGGNSNLCDEASGPESFFGSGTAVDQKWIDSPVKKQRDLTPKVDNHFRRQSSVCHYPVRKFVSPEEQQQPQLQPQQPQQQRQDDAHNPSTGAPLPAWVRKCDNSKYTNELCCNGASERTDPQLPKRAKPKPRKVDHCVRCTF